MKIATVLGARPQFIKASVVSSELEKRSNISEIVIHTGQHFDTNMSDVFFSELGMSKPDYSLDIHGGHHGEMTGRMLAEVERILLSEKPDAVLVYGDTNSTLAGALAAAKLHIPVAHVEAGLRSFNRAMPEEINRILTDRISEWLFTPTDDAVRHLESEGVDAQKIMPVGDVMFDVALHHGARADKRDNGAVQCHGLESEGYVLATIHRAENTDSPKRLQVIVDALIEVAQTLPVVWPIHPRTRAVLEKQNLLKPIDNVIQLIEPVGYLDMVQLERGAAVITTDSGGVQKEAYFHEVPCVTVRDETEWTELVEAGWNQLVPPSDAQELVSAIRNARGTAGNVIRAYGDGTAAEKIVTTLTTTER